MRRMPDAVTGFAAKAEEYCARRFGFWTHWGRHTVEALRIIHARLAEFGGPGNLRFPR